MKYGKWISGTVFAAVPLVALACSDTLTRSQSEVVKVASWEERAVQQAMALTGSGVTPVRINKPDRTVSGPRPVSPPARSREALDRIVAQLVEEINARMADHGSGAVAFDGGPDPLCFLELSGDEDDWEIQDACLNGLLEDESCEVVVIESYQYRTPPRCTRVARKTRPIRAEFRRKSGILRSQV